MSPLNTRDQDHLKSSIIRLVNYSITTSLIYKIYKRYFKGLSVQPQVEVLVIKY